MNKNEDKSNILLLVNSNKMYGKSLCHMNLNDAMKYCESEDDIIKKFNTDSFCSPFEFHGTDNDCYGDDFIDLLSHVAETAIGTKEHIEYCEKLLSSFLLIDINLPIKISGKVYNFGRIRYFGGYNDFCLEFVDIETNELQLFIPVNLVKSDLTQDI